MRHPGPSELALYAGGDLPFWRRWQVARHATDCADCKREADAFRWAREAFRSEAVQLPEEVNWKRLSAEMTANIRLGLAAGQCVAPVEAPSQRLGWRPAVALAMITLVVLTGWFLNAPAPKIAQAQGVVLEGNETGIEVKQNDRALAVLHPAAATYSVSSGGAIRARYVDSDTGQVTINNVYVE